jgi:hypothetical protein
MFNDFTISSRGILCKMMALKCHNIMRVNVCVWQRERVCVSVREKERVWVWVCEWERESWKEREELFGRKNGDKNYCRLFFKFIFKVGKKFHFKAFVTLSNLITKIMKLYLTLMQIVICFISCHLCYCIDCLNTVHSELYLKP